MVTIKSPIGTGNFVQNPVNKWSVPDETEQPQIKQISQEEVAYLKQQAQLRNSQNERNILSEKKNRVEFITEIGREYKNVSVSHGSEDITITLRTLKTFEKRAISSLFEKEAQISNGKVTFKQTSAFDIKVETLSHALYMIDGQQIEIVLGVYNQSYQEQKAAIENLIFNMDDALIDFLYKKYEELSKEVSDKYIPKTKEDLQEAAEAISKSG